MKEKIFSLLAGILIGVILCFGYNYFLNTKTNQSFSRNGGNSQMTPEKLQSTADRLGMTKEDLQKELDSGKNIRDIMTEKGVSFGGGRGASGSTRGSSGGGNGGYGFSGGQNSNQ
ncbi:MAG: hypothetical protein PHE25_02065 [Candidatus Gracilibacteria bacterium]|nr:hypothetical protein [Candidatus Gracilibacteria bacterium]